ncbi:MAG TPA: serine/threonine-protein kinase [Polyangia bacterium]|nr:serine/threonine-protein kinase [Polyangia bacterium]
MRFCPVDGAQVTLAVSDPNLGRELMGQFELREIAGRGAMGTVYRAYQRTMDRIVAVKILRPEIVREAGVLKRFVREARAAARLQHPNIVTVHMVGETEDGVPYLVMEHIDGVSLEAICEAQGPQPLLRVISIGRQIASALSEAHSLGIVHRDLKPANILVTDRSRTPDLVKVLDFGIAKILVATDAADQSMMTADGTIFGTPHYIAPEQASGSEVDTRADLYSLGCILFRLTTGVLPFEGTQSMQVVLKHLREEPPKPRSLNPELPQAMEDLILACLQKSRNKRPDDADTIIAALDRIEADARRPKSERLTPVVVNKAAPAAAVPAATTGPIAATPTGAHATGKLQPVRPTSPWANRAVWMGAFLAALVGAGVGVVAALTHNSVEESVVPPAPEHPAMARTARLNVPSVTVLPSTAVAPAVTTTAATPAKEAVKTARVEGRRRHAHADDDLPMTVVPSDPEPRVVAHSLPLNGSTATVTTANSAPAPAPTVTMTHPVAAPPPPVVVAAPPAPTVVAAPPQPKEPTKNAAKDDEPPPSPPPPANDPTTLPPPAPTN